MMWFMYANSSRWDKLMGFTSLCSPSSDNLEALTSTECLGLNIKGCMMGLGISWITLVFSWRGLEGFWDTSEGVGQWLFSRGDTERG